MAIVTLAGAPVLALRFTLPASGTLSATLECATDEVPSGVVALADEGLTFSCTVLRAGIVAGLCRVELVGGAGLRKELPARSYQNVTARSVVSDILSAAGERLDASSTASVLARRLPFWTRAGGSEGRASRSLSTLVEKLGARWRFTPSGAVWVGTETWPAAPPSLDEAVELDRDDAAGTVLLAANSLALRPGMKLSGRRVGRVEHSFGRDEPLRTLFWVEP